MENMTVIFDNDADATWIDGRIKELEADWPKPGQAFTHDARERWELIVTDASEGGDAEETVYDDASWLFVYFLIALVMLLILAAGLGVV